MRNKKGQFIDGMAGVSTRFTRESLLGNKHAKGNPPNKTSFTSEAIRLDKHPCWKGGIQITKRDGVFIVYESKKRMPRSRYNWIQVYGEIPKGYIIRHIDGNKHNDDISNLEAISRAENIIRNSIHR